MGKKFKKNIFVLSVIVLLIGFIGFKIIEGILSSSLPYICKDCNVIIVSVTNLRPDHMGSYGYFRNTTPNIDKFSEGSLVFENAFSHASWTLPAGMSLFTSLYPYTHKVMNRNPNEMLGSDVTTLVDILKSKGYKTASFTGGFDYSAVYNLVNRFDEYVIVPRNKFNVFGYGSLNFTVPLAINWLKENSKEKFFLFIQGFDAHCPFESPPPYDNIYDPDYNGSVDFSKCILTFNETEPKIIDGKTYYSVNTTYLNETSGEIGYMPITIEERDLTHMIALYDGKINYADESVGKLLKAIGKLNLTDKTIVVVLSEHGDIFGKHGRFMRGGPTRGTFYDDVLRIPLIIKNPKLEPKRVNGLVQLIDVMPTILDFLGIDTNKEAQGKSLVPLITDNKTVNEYVYAGTTFNPMPQNVFFKNSTRIEAVRNNDWKLIREQIFSGGNPNVTESVSYNLYDLRNDPEELTNVYGKNKGIAEDLNRTLFDWLKNIGVDPYTPLGG